MGDPDSTVQVAATTNDSLKKASSILSSSIATIVSFKTTTATTTTATPLLLPPLSPILLLVIHFLFETSDDIILPTLIHVYLLYIYIYILTYDYILFLPNDMHTVTRFGFVVYVFKFMDRTFRLKPTNGEKEKKINKSKDDREKKKIARRK